MNLIRGRGFLNRWSHKSGLFLEDKVADAVELFEKDLDLCEPDDDVMILQMIDGLCKADGLCKGRMVDDALQLLSRVVKKGIKPNVVSYSSSIKGLCDVSRLTNEKDMLTEMAYSKISLDVVTFNMFIDAYCKVRKMNETKRVVDQMPVKDVSWNTILSLPTCIMDSWKRQREFLMKCLRRMLSHGTRFCLGMRRMDSWMRQREYLIKFPYLGMRRMDSWMRQRKCSMKCHFLGMHRMDSWMRQREYSMKYTCLDMCGYVQNGFMDEAKRVFVEMPVKNVVSWNTILDEVVTLFDKMRVKNVLAEHKSV